MQAAEQAAAAAAAGLPLMQGNGVYMPEWANGQTPEWAQTALQQVSPKLCGCHMQAPTCHRKDLVAGHAASGSSPPCRRCHATRCCAQPVTSCKLCTVPLGCLLH